ncbi:MAG: hypothetical protein NTV46_03755 [Verrucomicrobia bacterium]|nr:hypothetical protein [Verrucomicrobiota bacterium]
MNLSADRKLQVLQLRNSFLRIFPCFAEIGETLQLLRRVNRLRAEGWVGPPPYLIKRAMLKAEALRIGANTFIETGTYMGDTLWFMRNTCKNLISVEVQPKLAEIARSRFRNIPQVEIVTGDSAVELKRVVGTIQGPCLFWLDGHYSAGMTGRGLKDCPIHEELTAIAQGSQYAFSILIDDARCFGTDPAYPSMEEMKNTSTRIFPAHAFEVWNDVIHIKLPSA